MAKYKLGDICEIVSGSTPKTEIDEYWDGDIKWITPAELNDDTYIITTIRIHERFEIENKNFGQKNDRSLTEVLTEVLTKKNYDKVLPIIKYLDKNGKITPQVAEMVIKKSKSTTYRYLTMLVDTGYVEVSGNTNNAVYKLSKG